MRFARSRARLLTALLFLLASLTPASRPSADATPLWLRYTAISPDGQTILFCYKGDIYSVPAAGGTATPKTLGESHEFAPVWSHDGKSIAFASDRYGDFDVFVMPAAGGEAARLTFHSTDEIPQQLHSRRQGGAVLGLPAGAGDRRAVPRRHHDPALFRRRHRRPRVPGAAYAGAGRDDRLPRAGS
jgi:hypothetical protein